MPSQHDIAASVEVHLKTQGIARRIVQVLPDPEVPLRRDDRGMPQRELGRSICLSRLASPLRDAVD